MADTEGGFLLPMPLSPPASTASQQTGGLPLSRKTPLKPGGAKESNVISYVDGRLMEISGKYERRGYADAASQGEDTQSGVRFMQGYRDFGQLATDVDQVLDVIWVSGTPSLQIPYLLNIALSLAEFMQAFQLMPRHLFPLLHKLDLAFASLMNGFNIESGEALPDAGARRVTTTEKVRLRGVIESTRLAVVAAAASSRHGHSVGQNNDSPEAESTAYETDSSTANDDEEGERDWGDFDMEAARVYELSIDQLGKSLDSGLISLYSEVIS